jgi:hypothetical protein
LGFPTGWSFTTHKESSGAIDKDLKNKKLLHQLHSPTSTTRQQKAVDPDKQITIKSPVAILKDLVTKDVGDEYILFCEDASNIISYPKRRRKTSVPVISVKIGNHCYYGLCDIGASASAIPLEFYKEIMHEIGACELEDIDVVVQLANRETVWPLGIVRDVEVLCGKTKYPTDFLVLGKEARKLVLLFLVDPF